MKPVAVLFARPDSTYKTLAGCDVWDAERDARNWPGGAPVVAHPPCRAWGRYAHRSKHTVAERDLAFYAVDMVRRYGGVLEHPATSRLWREADLPEPNGFPDNYAGWTMQIDQHRFGHRAIKPTRLYIVGIWPTKIPSLPPARADAPRQVELMCKAERERTPEEFAAWLVELARRIGEIKAAARIHGVELAEVERCIQAGELPPGG